MAEIYKSEITCEFCHKPILWYAIINTRLGETIPLWESDVAPHRKAQILRHDDRTALLRIYCKECDKVNDFSHTLPDD